MSQRVQQQRFTFRFVLDGAAQGFFAKKGSATAQGLTLSRTTVPFNAVRSTSVRDTRLVVGLEAHAAIGEKERPYLTQGNYLVVEVYGVEPAELKHLVDGAVSRRDVEAHRKALAAQGREEIFRSELCPECGAAVDLTELPETLYRYCPYCHSLFDGEATVVVSGSGYRLCDECGLYGHVKGHTEFYFYFLLVVYAWRYRRRRMCDLCAGKVFWKMLLCNTLFLIGLPHTFLLKVRSLTGRDPRLKLISRANALALDGRCGEARPIYETVRAHVPDHPGTLFNEAMGHLKGDDPNGALDLLHRSLEACANYVPAHDLLNRIEHIVDGTVGPVG